MVTRIKVYAFYAYRPCPWQLKGLLNLYWKSDLASFAPKLMKLSELHLTVIVLEWSFTKIMFLCLWNETAHNKTCNKTSATSKDSDQPVHPLSLIRVFADRMYLLQPLGYSESDKREPLPYWVDVQADLSLCWSHRSYCRFCHVPAKIFCVSA